MKSSVVSGENRGSVNEILLKALQSGDKYGYEINKEIETKSGGKFFLKEASLYSGLKRLQSAGFITSYWQDGELGIRRHYYSITQKGLNKLNSSNFTWDSSKEFLGDIFKNNNEQSTNGNFASKNQNENNVTSVNTAPSSQTSSNNDTEQKKNPFQIEVSPFQQSFFDLNNSETKPELEDLKSEDVKNNNNQNLDDIKSETNQSIANLKAEENISFNSENLSDISQNNNENIAEINEDKKQTNSYDELIKNYEFNNYSSSLQKENVIDIASLLAKNTQINDSSIVIEKPKTDNLIEQTITENIENVKQENDNSVIGLTNQSGSTENANFKSSNFENNQNLMQIDNKQTEQENTKEEEKVSVDFKNIFGSLLADNNQTADNQQEKTNEASSVIEQNVEETVEEVKQKQELPRINVDNDVNVMLKSDKKPTYSYDYTANNIQNRDYEDKIVRNNSSSTSVKQYIDNVHKQTLISRATTVSEEVNLEGINIREYTKMNNKLIKNSNYIYSNKLSMFLAILFAGLIIVESALSFIFLNKYNSLGTFEIILFSCSILFALTICFVYVRKFVKEKFKVELKNYNFKTNMFYFALIFVVCLVLIACINIFSGMNINNSGEFYIKFIFETLLLSNIIFYPIIKLIFFKMRYFTN